MAAASEPLFRSFFLGGFECSTHRNWSRRRLDLIASTAHDRFARADYLRLQEQGIRTARDGIRWHLIERAPYAYDFSSVLPMVRAARETGIQVIWDLCHYGWPDDLDIFAPAFIDRFAGMAGAFARLLASETDTVPFISPINEISFFAWAAGEVAYIHPFVRERGGELKAQLVRASINAIEAFWSVLPQTRIVHADPVINVVPDGLKPEDALSAELYRLAQFQAWDMLAGRSNPRLGGNERYLDIIGVNYYPHNQWIRGMPPFNPAAALPRTDPLYKPFRYILREAFERYRRPLFIAETGTEAQARVGWLAYVGNEVREAIDTGVLVEGICLYPVVNHPGWDDDRHCHNGLWDYADKAGERQIYLPLASELRRQQSLFEGMQAAHCRNRVAAGG